MSPFTVLVLVLSVLLQLAAPAFAVPLHPGKGNLTNATATALITRPIPTRLPLLPHFVGKYSHTSVQPVPHVLLSLALNKLSAET